MDLSQAKSIADSHYLLNDHPLLVVDLNTVRERYQDFKSHFPKVDVHFALKSLTDIEVAKTLADEGCSFEVASINELQLLAKILSPQQLYRVFYSNPAKSKRSIYIALIAGIRWFSVDSIEEIQKICMLADSLQIDRANLKLYLRIEANSKNSYWPLSAKYGAPIDKALSIMDDLVWMDVKLSGFTFHVGSQCMDYTAWGNAILDVDALIDYGTRANVISEKVMINMGGGFPSDVTQHNTTLEMIADYIVTSIGRCIHWDRINLAAEPGRFIAQNCGTLVSRVILTTEKNNQKWIYLDLGVYHGLIEPSQGVIGRVSTTFVSEEMSTYKLSGPSCDSADILPMEVELPTHIAVDDLIFIENSGAYAMAYATGNADRSVPGFNGFLPPSVYYIHK